MAVEIVTQNAEASTDRTGRTGAPVQKASVNSHAAASQHWQFAKLSCMRNMLASLQARCVQLHTINAANEQSISGAVSTILQMMEV